MHPSRPGRRSSHILAASLAATAAAAAAEASIVVSTTGGIARYRVSFMPDYDQRRSAATGITGLASNGSNFCATTSGTDLLSYVRQHGYALAGMPDWQWSQRYTSTQYESVTTTIATVGTQMGTVRSGANAGTSAGQWLTGMTANLPADCFTITQFVFTSTWAPTCEWLAPRLTNGTWGVPLANICCGWYVSNPDGSGALLRNGGHCMALIGVTDGPSADVDQLCFRDPWTGDSESRTVQSEFASACFPFATSNFTVGSASSSSVRAMSVINGYSGGNGLLDKVYVVEPVTGLTSDLTGAFIDVVRPVRFSFEPAAASRVRLTVNPGGTIVDAVKDMYSTGILAVVQRTGNTVGSLKMVSSVTGAAVTINTGGTDVVAVASGRFGEAYALNRVSPTVHDLSAVSLQPSGQQGTQPPLVRRMPMVLDAIAYDDATDRVLGVNAASKSLIAVARGANGIITTSQLPTAWTLVGKVAVATDPRNGRVYITSAGGSTVYGLDLSASGQVTGTEAITSTALVNPQALEVNGLGDLVFVAAGKTSVLRKGTQGWSPVPGSPLANLTANRFFHLGRSRINVPAGSAALLETDEVAPTTVPPASAECDADLDLDGLVNGADLGLLLSFWGTPSIADLNQDGNTDGADLGMLLAAWGPCP